MMKIIYPIFSIVITTQLVLGETVIEMRVTDNLKILEDKVYNPSDKLVMTLNSQLTNIISNTSDYIDEATRIVNSHVQNITEEIQSIIDRYQAVGIDSKNCEVDLQTKINQIKTTTLDDINNVEMNGNGEQIIAHAQSVFSSAQNKTASIRSVAQNCMSLADDEECLVEILDEIIMQQFTLPTIISTTGIKHQALLKLLEEEGISELEEIVAEAFENYVQVLDHFLICIVQQ